MAYMKVRSLLGRDKDKLPDEGFIVQGLPPVNYYLPIVVTMLATLTLFLVIAFLTVVAFGNAANAWNASNVDAESAPMGILLCGSFGIIGTIMSIYFFYALVKGVRDLTTPLYYTRGSLADKRAIAGRMAGDWIGVSPQYAGTEIEKASVISDEQAAASVDRSQIVHTRSTPGLRTPPKRSGYLSRDRISTQQVEVAPQSLGQPGPRVVFRVDQKAYAQLQSGEEILIAHSRFLEHIYYISHLRNGQWESFKNKTLI